jgi:hypothetical protein
MIDKKRPCVVSELVGFPKAAAHERVVANRVLVDNPKLTGTPGQRVRQIPRDALHDNVRKRIVHVHICVYVKVLEVGSVTVEYSDVTHSHADKVAMGNLDQSLRQLDPINTAEGEMRKSQQRASLATSQIDHSVCCLDGQRP